MAAYTQSFPATIPGVSGFLDHFCALYFTTTLPERLQSAIRLTLEEICVGILDHVPAQPTEIEMKCMTTSDEMIFSLIYTSDKEDWISDHPIADISSPVSTRQTHGLGLRLAQQHTRYIDFCLLSGNIACIRFDIPLTHYVI